jgi:hypothetical protein
MYAKMALLMFYPFQQLNDLKYDGSYWRLFHNELQKHINKEDTVFWKLRRHNWMKNNILHMR